MRKREFERYYARYRMTITALARKLASTNDELVRDLEQEGAFALWRMKLKPIRRNEDSAVRQYLKFRMIDYLRRVDVQQYESLDARISSGDQLTYDSETGEVTLHTQRRQPPQLLDETFHEAGDDM